MFARVNSSVHVCLRCQKRLLNNIPVKSSSQLRAQSPLRRWQSNAVAKFEEEDEEDIDHNSASDRSPPITRGSTPARDKSRPRIWRPTASLGVNSFGKPAEVLILRARDRKIPTAVYDTVDEDGSATTLQESLDSEQAPLDHTSLHRAMNDVYHKFVGNRDNPEADLTLEEYDSIKKQFTDSFTPKQILHYLNTHTSGQTPLEKKGKGYTSSTLMRGILTNVWNLNPPLDALEARKRANRKKGSYSYIVQDEAELDHLLTAHRQPLREIAKKNQVNIEVFRRQRRLKVTGVNHEAQLGLQAITKYVKKLESIVVPFDPEYSVYADPSERDAVRAFLQRIQEKYRIHVALRENDVKIVHYNMASAARAKQAAREISIVGDSRLESYEIHVPQSHDADPLALERFPTPPEFARGLSNRPWHRLLVTDTPNVTLSCTTPATDQKSDSTMILQRLKLFFDCGGKLPVPTKRRDLRFHVTAHFGQALFRSRSAPAPRMTTKTPSILVEDLASDSLGEIADITDQPWDLSITEGTAVGDFEESDSKTLSEIFKSDSGEPVDQGDLQTTGDYLSDESYVPPSHYSSNIIAGKEEQNAKPTTASSVLVDPAFSCDVPYALQQFARLNPWKNPIKGAQADISAAPTQTTYRLEFICSSLTSIRRKLPVFEVYVSSTARSNKSEGERPSLELLRVSAIHDQRSFYALCPKRHVDIKFTQQLKQDLTYPNNDMPHFFRKIRTAFDSYLANSELSEHKEWSFGPCLEIAVDSSMRNVARRGQLSVAPDQASSFERECLVSGSKPETTGSNKGSKLEYCLRRAEIVEVDSSSMPVPIAHKELKRTNLCFENITFSGAEQTRQEILLSDHSLFSAPNLKNQDLTTLVNGALGLAEYLGNDSSEYLETLVGSFVSSQNNWSDEPQTESTIGTSDSTKGKKKNRKKDHKKSITSTSHATGHDSTKEPSSSIKAKSNPKLIKSKIKETKSKSEARDAGVMADSVAGKESSKTKPKPIKGKVKKIKSKSEARDPDVTVDPVARKKCSKTKPMANPKQKPKVKLPKKHWIGRGSVKAKAEGG